METIKIAGLIVRVIIVDSKYLVPIKFFCADHNLNFEKIIIKFNSYGFKVNCIMQEIENDEYLCLKIEDFVLFLIVISDTDTKLIKYRDAICKIIATKCIMPKSHENIEIIKLISKNYKVPGDNDKFQFVTASMVSDFINLSLFYKTNNSSVGHCMKSMGFKKIAKRVGSNVRYGYAVIKINTKS